MRCLTLPAGVDGEGGWIRQEGEGGGWMVGLMYGWIDGLMDGSIAMPVCMEIKRPNDFMLLVLQECLTSVKL